MYDRTHFVKVRELPECMDQLRRIAFCREFESCINVDRPAVILDCSKLRQMDKDVIHLLLCCLEEAMKRNGDVRLAALRPDARKVLNSYRLDRVFEMFGSIDDAFDSFRLWPVSVAQAYPRADEAEDLVSIRPIRRSE